MLSTGRHNIACREWIVMPEVQKTHDNFKIILLCEYQTQNYMQATTTSQSGYKYANMVQNETDLQEAIQNFATLSVVERNAFKTLTTTNA